MSRILLVDDDRASRQALRALLEARRFVVVEAGDAESALSQVDASPPDAVLVDPGADGLGLVQRLRERLSEHFVPLMVVTAVAEPGARSAALRRGADEYVVKPFDPRDLTGRLDVLLDVQAHRRALARRHAELVGLQEYRDDLVNLLIHDLKNPLAVITSNLHYLRGIVAELGVPDALEAFQDAMDASSLLQRMIGNLVDVGRAEGGGGLALTRTTVDVGELLQEVARMRARLFEQRRVKVEVSAPPGLTIHGDRDVLRRAVENLVENALRYAGAGGRIRLVVRADATHLVVEIANTGPAIPVEHRRLVFEKFGQLRRRSGMPRIDLGLGLYFCRLAMEAHGGTIRVEETPDFPTTFVLDLPRE